MKALTPCRVIGLAFLMVLASQTVQAQDPCLSAEPLNTDSVSLANGDEIILENTEETSQGNSLNTPQQETQIGQTNDSASVAYVLPPPPDPCEPGGGGGTTCTLPTAYSVSGGGSACSYGGDDLLLLVRLSDSQTGVTYKLYRGTTFVSSKSGTGGALSWPAPSSGTYTVTGTNTCGTKTMSGSASVSYTTPPTSFSVSGGGIVCNGVANPSITLSGSQGRTTYQLKLNGVNAQPAVTGNGSPITWSNLTATGTYTVTASFSSCQNIVMSGSAQITTGQPPTIYNVTKEGINCNGTAYVALSGSQPGTSYNLKKDNVAYGNPVSGTGSRLEWQIGITPGSYTVQATTSAGCTADMSGSASVFTAQLPNEYSLTNSGIICADSVFSVSLNGSQVGLDYHLVINGVISNDAIVGTGNPINWSNIATGSYTVNVKNNAVGCSYFLSTASSIKEIEQHTLSGGGVLCSDSSGLNLRLNNSQVGVRYQLEVDGIKVGASVAGTGNALTWNSTQVGVYSVLAFHPALNCSELMVGNPVISLSPIKVFSISKRGDGLCGTDTIRLNGSQDSVTYKVRRNGNYEETYPNTTGTGSAISWHGLYASGTYTIEAFHSSSGCKAAMQGSVEMNCHFEHLQISETLKIAVPEQIPFDFRLAVGGKILTTGISLKIPEQWPDYVFTDAYNLLPVEKVEIFIRENGHLPNMLSARQMQEKKYYNVNNMDAKLLEKIEELTLYILEIDQEINKGQSTPFKIASAENAHLDEKCSDLQNEDIPSGSLFDARQESINNTSIKSNKNSYLPNSDDVSSTDVVGSIFSNLNIDQSLVIGSAKPAPLDCKLVVRGNIIAAGLDIKAPENWPDYVFSVNYPLLSIEEVSAFVKQRGHLPNINSTREMQAMENYQVSEMDAKLLEKIEELTLYIIQLKQLANSRNAYRLSTTDYTLSSSQPLIVTNELAYSPDKRHPMQKVSSKAVSMNPAQQDMSAGLMWLALPATLETATVTQTVSIGTTKIVPNYKLAVAGKMLATEAAIQPPHKWPDYVFEDGYPLMPLDEVRVFIKRNGHLPNVMSSLQMRQKENYDVAEMDAKLLEKIEELMLYIIALHAEIK